MKSFFSTLQTSYEEQITSLRGVKKTLKRTSPTSAVKSGNFSAEVCQLLTSSFANRRVADFRACSPLGKMDASFKVIGLVVLGICFGGRFYFYLKDHFRRLDFIARQRTNCWSRLQARLFCLILLFRVLFDEVVGRIKSQLACLREVAQTFFYLSAEDVGNASSVIGTGEVRV